MDKMFDSSFRYGVSSFPHTDTSSRVVVFRVRLVELPVRMQVSSIESCFDRRSFRSTKVDSIEDKSQFDRRL